MHAASYFMVGYRFMWFKVYRTGYAFADFFNSLADNIPNFDYNKAIYISTLEQYEHFLEFSIPKSANKESKKKQTLMANMFFEANLFGIKLETASIHSKPNLFHYEESENTIYMPLTSLPGISNDAVVIREILDSVDLKTPPALAALAGPIRTPFSCRKVRASLVVGMFAASTRNLIPLSTISLACSK
jgi:DNA polymerase III alpha subunit (gram-positive type)